MVTTKKSVDRQRKRISFKTCEQVSDNLYELSKNKETVTEMYPIHCGLAVLHYSKRILMDFVMFLYEFLEENSYEYIYSGIFYYS